MAEERARQEAAAAVRTEEPPTAQADHSDEESALTGPVSQAESAQTVEVQS